MDGTLVFGATLLTATLVSEYASRSALSTAVLVMAVGFAVGDGALGLVPASAADPRVRELIQISLFAVLLGEGMHASWRELRDEWRLVTSAILVAMPVAALLTAVVAHALGGLAWRDAAILAAVLAPTDPALAAALVRSDRLPTQLRRLLNLESGINDGVALPAVLALLQGSALAPAASGLVVQTTIAVAIGVALPWLVIRLHRSSWLGIARDYRDVSVIAVGLILWSAAPLVHANAFIAAFVAGLVIASLARDPIEGLRHVPDRLGEVLKLLALFLFGALLRPGDAASIGAGGWITAAFALFAARPLSLLVGLRPARIGGWGPWLAAAWFGPRGLGTILYAMIVLASRPDVAGRRVFAITAAVAVASIVVHSSTDLLAGRWLGAAVAPTDERSPA